MMNPSQLDCLESISAALDEIIRLKKIELEIKADLAGIPTFYWLKKDNEVITS